MYDTREMTKQDLDGYLAGLERQRVGYRANKVVHANKPDEVEYADKMLAKLDRMAVYAIAKYHEKDLPEEERIIKIVSNWYIQKWISYKEFLRLSQLPF